MSNTILIVITAHQSGHLSSGQIRAKRSHNLTLGQTKPAFEDLRLQQQAEMKRMINCHKEGKVRNRRTNKFPHLRLFCRNAVSCWHGVLRLRKLAKIRCTWKLALIS